jgi:hypothetical protein
MALIFFIAIPKLKINSKPVNPFGGYLPIKGVQPPVVASNNSHHR